VKTWKDPYLIGFDILVNEIYMINRVKYDVVVEKKKKNKRTHHIWIGLWERYESFWYDMLNTNPSFQCLIWILYNSNTLL